MHSSGILAAGSVAAQGYLAEQQRPARTVSAARLGVPAVGGAPRAITLFGHGPLESALSSFHHATDRATRGLRPLARAVGDTAMAGWFSSSLMGLVAVDRAVGELSDPVLGLWAVDEVWDRWAVPGSVASPRKQAIRDAGDGARVHGAPTPLQDTRREIARAQKRCRTAEYAVCALTGAVVVLVAKMSEEQRPVSTLRRVGS